MVLIGGGFGGLYAARSLKRAPVGVTLVDRRNFHLFQPLLYQVATGGLSPGEIASPLRSVLARQRNATVLLGEVVDIDVGGRRVLLSDGEVGYDELIVATGATHHYFGHHEWADRAPGLKTIEDATEIRSRILLASELPDFDVPQIFHGIVPPLQEVVAERPSHIEEAHAQQAMGGVAYQAYHRQDRRLAFQFCQVGHMSSLNWWTTDARSWRTTWPVRA